MTSHDILSTIQLMLAGIRDILIISTPDDTHGLKSFLVMAVNMDCV
jgi:dTDP-glucose pyrophosphorylase